MNHDDEGDVFSTLVHEQSLRAVEEADLLVVLMDAQQGVTPGDRELVETLRRQGKPCILVVNKVDGPSQEKDLGEFYELGFERILPLSAEHGRGLRDFAGQLAERLTREGIVGTEKPPAAKAPAAAEASHAGAMRVALIGRPNVGKSSLFNRLVGEPRMIVTDIPGTTRDAVNTLLERPGKRAIVFTDTAGVRRKARVRDRVEKFSALKAIDAIRTCGIALVILDATEGITDQDKRLIGYTAEHGRAAITAFNKWDLLKGNPALVGLRMTELKRAKKFASYAPHLNISALTGRHTDRILPLIDSVYKEFETGVTTGKANQILRKALALRNPPISKGHHLKLYYTTQVGSAPPTFVIFANYPKQVPEQYRRFLANQFREQLNLVQCPIRLIFRERERRP
jgi:GTP-binding protein